MSSAWRSLAEQWLALADQDLALARVAFHEPTISDPAFGLHVQQAIEKSLKAVIATRGTLPPPTHDLVWLLDHSGQEEHPFDLDALDLLSPYASAMRQPGLPLPPRHLDREQALARASEAWRWAGHLVAGTP